MGDFLKFAFLGVGAGAAYALSALGLVVIYKGSRTLNFAQGAIGMVGAFIFTTSVDGGHGNAYAVVAGVLASTVVGAVSYLLVMRPLRSAPELARMAGTFGLLLVILGIAELHWGNDLRSAPTLIAGGTVHLAGAILSWDQILAVGAAVVALAFFYLGFHRTTIGRAIEASSISESDIARFGYRASVLGLLTWSAGSALAGIGGILISVNLGSIDQTTLTEIVLQALVAGLIGGFERLGLAVLSGFMLGMLSSILVFSSSIPGIKDVIPFGLAVVALVLFGRGVPTRLAATVQRLPRSPRPKLITTRAGVSVLVAAVLIVILSPFYQGVVTLGMAFVVVALSVVVIVGFVGQVSLMQWSIAGYGAFMTGWFALHWHTPMLLSLAIAAASAFPLGLLVGFPALRVRGINLSIITLGAALAIESLFLVRFGFGGETLPAPGWLGHPMSPLGRCIVTSAITATCCFGVVVLRRSKIGQDFVAIRASERAAAASGVNVRARKLLAFAIAAFLAALGGGLWAYQVGTIEPSSFDVLSNVNFVALTFLNGIGVVLGAIASGLFLSLGPAVLTFQFHVSSGPWFSIVSGIGLLFALIRHPDGVFVHSSPQMGGKQRRALLAAYRPTRRWRGRGGAADAERNDVVGRVIAAGGAESAREISDQAETRVGPGWE